MVWVWVIHLYIRGAFRTRQITNYNIRASLFFKVVVATPD
jgi:hypothetical protein